MQETDKNKKRESEAKQIETVPAYIVEPMHVEDIPEVHEIEKECFSLPWPAHAYEREIRENRMARYVVARPARFAGLYTAATTDRQEQPFTADGKPLEKIRGKLTRVLEDFFGPANRHSAFRQPDQSAPDYPTAVGYCGVWLGVGEVHITTIGVRSDYRRQGIGELLLLACFDIAYEYRADEVTLEVRKSNFVAQNLYIKYGFKAVGVRKRYYSDNNEDAIIMTTEQLDIPQYRVRLAALAEDLNRRLIMISENEAKGIHHNPPPGNPHLMG